MEQLYYTISDSLLKDAYLETDGEAHWWIFNGKYEVIPKHIFKAFISQKLVYAKRIDDETTCYYPSQDKK